MSVTAHRAAGVAAAIVIAAYISPAPRVAHADDKVDFTTTWYQEKRRGTQGGLTIIHPQFDFGIDLGDSVSLGAGYAADVVTGATSSVYSVDAVASATEFDDTRHQGSLSLGFRGTRSSLTLAGGIANERDYLSLSVTASGAIDLPGKNTNLALSYTHSRDEVCDRDNTGVQSDLEKVALTGLDPCEKNSGLFGKDTMGVTVWQDLSIDTAQATITQNLSPTWVGQLTLFGQVMSGFQENPYRRVRVSGIEAQETLPDVRARVAVMLRINKYLPSLRSAVHGSLRGYSDTWGINSGTVEMGYSQYVGDKLLFKLRGRIYQQTEAAFFKDAFFYETEGPAGAYFTGDREMAPLRNLLFGAKLSYISVGKDGKNVWGVFDEVSVNVKGDILMFSEQAADRPEDNPMGIDQQFLSSGQTLDAFVLQLGLRLLY